MWKLGLVGMWRGIWGSVADHLARRQRGLQVRTRGMYGLQTRRWKTLLGLSLRDRKQSPQGFHPERSAMTTSVEECRAVLDYRNAF